MLGHLEEGGVAREGRGLGERGGVQEESGEVIGKGKGRVQVGADLGKPGSQGAGQRGRGLCGVERSRGGADLRVCLCFSLFFWGWWWCL